MLDGENKNTNNISILHNLIFNTLHKIYILRTHNNNIEIYDELNNLIRTLDVRYDYDIFMGGLNRKVSLDKLFEL